MNKSGLFLLIALCCSPGAGAINVSEHPELLSLVDAMVEAQDFSRAELLEILSGSREQASCNRSNDEARRRNAMASIQEDLYDRQPGR